DSGWKSYIGASVVSILFQVSLDSNRFSYCLRKSSGVTLLITASLTSLIDGQLSFIYSLFPFCFLILDFFFSSNLLELYLHIVSNSYDISTPMMYTIVLHYHISFHKF